jgi:hypothetical protein
MDQTSCSAVSRHTLHCALELSKKSWLLAIQFPDGTQPSLHSIEGGNTEKLMAKRSAARDCWAKMSGSMPAITLCYEVGYDAFWLARFLRAREIECIVIDPGSVQVNRRGRRIKTDRVDVKMLRVWKKRPSSKLIHGLRSKTAAGFRSRRGRCHEPTPVTPHYAPFASYKTAGRPRHPIAAVLLESLAGGRVPKQLAVPRIELRLGTQ